MGSGGSFDRCGRRLIVLSSVVVFFASACGSEPPEGSPAARPDLTPFLLRADEEPGFAPTGEPETITAVGEVFEGSADDEERLRDEGFEVFVFQPLEGTTGAGITNVMLFTDAEGANRELRDVAGRVDEDFEGWTITRFDIAAVPGGRGFTASKPGEHSVGNFSWVQGRCLLTLGNEGDVDADPAALEEPLRTGVTALHERTARRCP